tara:strand:+ start:748 stop:990 length:243 start_codon:yes stop_codon:yes gene_type:complete
MNVGDLVTLSSHGNTLNLMRHRKGKVGMIVEREKRYSHVSDVRDPLEYRYKVKWLCSGRPFDPFEFHRRDLKFVNKGKKK